MNGYDIYDQIEQLKRESVEARIALIARTFPDVMQDAERFVEGTNACPWELYVAFVDGDLAAIQDKYGVQSSRHRPRDPELPPLTGLFYEACDLLYGRLTGEQL